MVQVHGQVFFFFRSPKKGPNQQTTAVPGGGRCYGGTVWKLFHVLLYTDWNLVLYAVILIIFTLKEDLKVKVSQ